MPDQTIPDVTDDDRRLAREWAEFIESDMTALSNLRTRAAARVLLAVLPKRPTLADMTEEDRDECRWMQCDVQGQGGAWLIVAPFDDDDEDYAHVVGRQGSKSWGFPAEYVTPRPDLPRMTWPGNKKPVPALPEGWRLADHEDYGRGIVTNPTPNGDGLVYLVIPADDPMGYDWFVCPAGELTYLDTEPEEA